MTEDHEALLDIENRKAQTDLGIFAYRIYAGAVSDGASPFEAMFVLAGWFVGLQQKPPDEEL